MAPWANELRQELARAEQDNTDEGHARLTLDALPRLCYEAKREYRKSVLLSRNYAGKLWCWNSNKTFADLTGHDKLVVEALIAEGFQPFIEEEQDRHGFTEYYLRLPV